MKRKLFSTFMLASTLGLALPLAAQDCVDFQGIEHCAVGGASLDAGSNGLVVQTASNGGGDGVSSRFAPTTLWTADLEFPEGEVERTELASISGGETTSRLIVEPEGDGHRVRATFTGSSTGSTYSVLVYRDGVLQGAVGGLDGSDGTPDGVRGDTRKLRIVINDWVLIDTSRRRRNRFSIAPPGGCNWGLGLEQSASVHLPDGQVVEGDEIVFAEDVEGPGHYPYLGFESIEVATTVSSFTILDEAVEHLE